MSATEPAGPAAAAEPRWVRWLVPALVVAAAAWLYVQGVLPAALQNQGFDHNAWEAAALLSGHVHTPPPPPGDTLDMGYYRGAWYSFFPPLPAVLLMPLVLIVRDPLHTPVRLFCALLGAACPLILYDITRRAALRVAVRLWLTALFAFGTVFWYATAQGTPWYYVQVCTVFFYLLALRESFGDNRPWAVAALFGAALLCRNTVALGLPFLFWREARLDWRRVAGFLGPVAAAVGVQLWWNWARTGNPLDTGYAHILMGAGFRPSFAEGMFSLLHLPWQLYSMFIMAPGFNGLPNNNGLWPYLMLSSAGQSILLTTPAFIYVLEGRLRERGVWLGLASAALTAIPQLLYYANGTSQFGNRFSLDYTPLLMCLLIFGIGRRFRWQHALLIVLSVGMAGYGAVVAGNVHLLPPSWLAAAALPAGCPQFPWLLTCPHP